jgi:hypothetical protein
MTIFHLQGPTKLARCYRTRAQLGPVHGTIEIDMDAWIHNHFEEAVLVQGYYAMWNALVNRAGKFRVV